MFFLLSGCSETPADYPYNELKRCEKYNGVCTYDQAVICPPGKQPLTANDPEETNCLGQCCIEQEKDNSCNPASEDTDEFAQYNCVPDQNGTQCAGIWEMVNGNLSCDDGRSCCYWRY